MASGRRPEKDPWANAKWVSDRPTKKAGAGTRLVAFFFMIPAGAVLANLVVGTFLAMTLGMGVYFVRPGFVEMLIIGAIGAVLGGLAVLFWWPSEDEAWGQRKK